MQFIDTIVSINTSRLTFPRDYFDRKAAAPRRTPLHPSQFSGRSRVVEHTRTTRNPFVRPLRLGHRTFLWITRIFRVSPNVALKIRSEVYI